jgi:hypothetical protein
MSAIAIGAGVAVAAFLVRHTLPKAFHGRAHIRAFF